VELTVTEGPSCGGGVAVLGSPVNTKILRWIFCQCFVWVKVCVRQMQGIVAIHDLWCQTRGCWLLIGNRRSIGFEAQSQLAVSTIYTTTS